MRTARDFAAFLFAACGPPRTGRRADTRWRGRRRATILTALFSILLAAGASIGCREEPRGKRESPEQTAARAPPSEGEAPAAQSLSAEDSVPGEPKIQFEQLDHDFGDAEAGQELEHAFPFRNIGEGDLVISNVLTSCGCTAAPVSGERIPPGETGEIRATFDTRGFQGAVKKALTVESNDPENRLVRLTIGGQVLSEVAVHPRYLNWERFGRDSPPAPVRLRIRFLEGRGLRLEEIHAESPSILLEKESESDNEVVYSVTLAEDLPTGRFTGRISVRTNSRRVPEIHVPFYGQVEGTAKVIPHILSLGRIKPGQTSTHDLSVTRTGQRNFSIQKVGTTTKAITTEVIEERAGERYRIKVTYKAGSRTRGSVSERITIFVNDGEENLLEVPVYGTVGDGAERPAL